MTTNTTLFPILAPYEFEKYVDGEEEIRIRKDGGRWLLTIGYSLIYISVVFILKAVMKNRRAFELNYPLVLWNLAMASFNIFGTVRMVPGYLHLVCDHGYAFSLCDQSYGLKMPPSVYWGIAFSWLKMIEFGDTIFLVLRKRKLKFLHCYHHAMTSVITEYSIASRIPIGHGFIVANYICHSLMYSYYAFMALQIRLPKIVGMNLTIIQILQMVFGAVQCFFAFYFRANRKDCYFPLTPIIFVIMMYVSYLILFCCFFHTEYIARPRKSKIS